MAVELAQQLIELKKAVDKQEQDIRTSKARIAALRGDSAEAESKDMPQTPMDVDDGVDGEGDGEGRAQSVVSTRSTRSRKQVRLLMTRPVHR